MYIHIHTYIYTYIYIYIYIYMYIYIHTYIHAYIHTYQHTYAHAYVICTCVHTHTHTYVYYPTTRVLLLCRRGRLLWLVRARGRLPRNRPGRAVAPRRVQTLRRCVYDTNRPINGNRSMYICM